MCLELGRQPLGVSSLTQSGGSTLRQCFSKNSVSNLLQLRTHSMCPMSNRTSQVKVFSWMDHTSPREKEESNSNTHKNTSQRGLHSLE